MSHGTECEVEARAHGGAVDRGDGRERRAEHAQEAFVDRTNRAALALVLLFGERAERGDVGTGTERRRFSGDHDRAHVIVGFERVERVDDLTDHRRGHRVAPFEINERHERDAVVPVDAYVFHQSRRMTAGECRKKSSTSRS